MAGYHYSASWLWSYIARHYQFMMFLVQKCKYKYTERWCAKELKNKAMATTASYINTFSVAIWWLMYKFNTTRHFTEALSQGECQSLLHRTSHLESQATTALHFESWPYLTRKPWYTQNNSWEYHSQLRMISYTYVIQNPFLPQTWQIFLSSVTRLLPPIIIRGN